MAASKEEERLVFEVFLIGDSGVGKSCLLQRFSEGTYREIFTPTTGVDLRTWTIPLEEKTIRLQINDVAGRELNRTVIPSNYKKAHGFIIVFDLTDETTFLGVTERLRELQSLRNKNAVRILVGNKCDMQAEKVIPFGISMELANKWGMRFLETSAKDGTNVAQIFVGIAADIKNRLHPEGKVPRRGAQYVETSRRQERFSMDRRNPAASLRLERGNMNRPSHAGGTAPLPPKKSPSQPCDYTFNIILIGDSGVGKSCLMLRFTDDQYTDLTLTTVCLDVKSRSVEIEGHTVKLLIKDTAGQEKFHCITLSFFRGADGIIMVYDVTKKESFENLNTWLQEMDEYAREDTVKILVGAKSDNTEDKAVSHSLAQSFAEKLGIPFFEASAKSGANVEEVFTTIAALIKTRVGPPKNRNNTVSPNDCIRLQSHAVGPEGTAGTANSKKWYRRC